MQKDQIDTGQGFDNKIWLEGGGVMNGALAAPPAERIAAADARSWRRKSMAGWH
jgi:hypothetical protein